MKESTFPPSLRITVNEGDTADPLGSTQECLLTSRWWTATVHVRPCLRAMAGGPSPIHLCREASELTQVCSSRPCPGAPLDCTREPWELQLLRATEADGAALRSTCLAGWSLGLLSRCTLSIAALCCPLFLIPEIPEITKAS